MGQKQFIEIVSDGEKSAAIVTEESEPSGQEAEKLTARARDDRIAGVETPTQRIRKLRCDKHHMPYATVDYERRVLIIIARHHNEWCENIIPLLDLGLQALDPNSGTGKSGKHAKKPSANLAPETQSATTE